MKLVYAWKDFLIISGKSALTQTPQSGEKP
jgi:hypothetical protein